MTTPTALILAELRALRAAVETLAALAKSSEFRVPSSGLTRNAEPGTPNSLSDLERVEIIRAEVCTRFRVAPETLSGPRGEQPIRRPRPLPPAPPREFTSPG